MSEMADKLSVNGIVMSKDAVYFKMLQDYGQSTFIKLMKGINPRDYGIKYFETKQEDTKGTTYKVYKGSSEFDSKEMTIFIKGIVQECEQLGIETLPPRELEELNIYLIRRQSERFDKQDTQCRLFEFMKQLPDKSIDLVCIDHHTGLYKVAINQSYIQNLFFKNDGKIFEHNDISIKSWVPDVYRV